MDYAGWWAGRCLGREGLWEGDGVLGCSLGAMLSAGID